MGILMAMKKEKAQPVVCTRVPARTRRALLELAREMGVNLAEYVRWLLIRHAGRQSRK